MNDQQARVAGIVLAAGTSSRMGRNKLLLEIDGEPLIRRIVEHAIEAKLDPVIVVTGHERELVTAALDGLSHRAVVNPDFEHGMTTSLQAGIAALPEEVEATLMILGDMPNVSSAMMMGLVEEFRTTETDLVLSRYGTVNAPPTLFGKALFQDLLDLPGNHPPRSVVRRYGGAAQFLDWPETCLKDLDSPEDLERL